MAMSELERDEIFLLFALTESARALRAMEEVERLAGLREKVQEGVERREFQSVFDHIRLALQFSGSLSRIFWPHQNAEARGARLRALAGLPDRHSLSDRRLRNHVEHVDERLDEWTIKSPRPFVGVEMILHDDYPQDEMRDGILGASAVVYDAKANSIILFGDTFSLADLRAAVKEVQVHCSKGLGELTAKRKTFTG